MYLITWSIRAGLNRIKNPAAYCIIRTFSNVNCCIVKNKIRHRGGSRTAATSKMEDFVIIVNGFQPLTIITKNTILDVAAVLDPSVSCCFKSLLLEIYNLKVCSLWYLKSYFVTFIGHVLGPFQTSMMGCFCRKCSWLNISSTNALQM